MSKSVEVKGVSVSLKMQSNSKYISLTDIAKYKNPGAPADVIKNWLRSRDTIEFLGLWEKINNSKAKLVEIDQFKKQAGSNAFTMSPAKWIENTNAIGLISSSGKYGGTYAHRDIAFEFASWISAEFKLYLIKEFQRLVDSESTRQNLEWSVSRTIAKINYRIHTGSIMANLIPKELTNQQKSLTFACEADYLNIALFSQTAKDWREQNPDKSGNIRDYASLEQLIVLSNMESLNAEYIKSGFSQLERLEKLNRMAIEQMQVLTGEYGLKELKKLN
jgi:hypothetical protein